jgi:DNA-binding NarL/FixJ family response regulator
MSEDSPSIQSFHVMVGRQRPAAAAPGPPDGTQPVDPARVRVLLADDDAGILEAMRDVLADIGFLIVGEAENGRVAVERVPLLLPHVVLMDLRMPEMNGLDATRAIRAAHPAVQVVIVSAYDDASLRQEARRAGAHGYVVKGASVEEIESAILAAAAAAT